MVNPKTLSLIEDIFNEISDLFKDGEFHHLGFDEFHLDCYYEDEFLIETAQFFAEHNITTSIGFVKHFFEEVSKFTEAKGKKNIIWFNI